VFLCEKEILGESSQGKARGGDLSKKLGNLFGVGNCLLLEKRRTGKERKGPLEGAKVGNGHEKEPYHNGS